MVKPEVSDNYVIHSYHCYAIVLLGGPVCVSWCVLLEFCQAFGHLAPFKKQIEVGTVWV